MLDYLLAISLQLSSPPKWLTGWAEVILSSFSVIISYLLYRLYGQQKELLAADHKAIVSGKLQDSDTIESEISLSNYGNGIAKDLKLITYFTVPEDYKQKYSEVGVYLNQDGLEGVEGSVLQPGEKEEFSCKPKIGVRETEDSETWDMKWLLEAFNEMKQDGIKEVKFCFVVEYQEFTGESQTVIITPFAATIDLQNDRYSGYPTGMEFMATDEQEAKNVFPEALSAHRHEITIRDQIRIWIHRLKEMINI
ncbi:hypothetical protein [Natrinema saccharevitans]|uniref:hypothetical protein n=1 Tax=Natrinema saccharevitans TaxID=301967 RepID=UPI0011157E80|nr:hypothetical protein [Natrinema saccharevitans]